MRTAPLITLLAGLGLGTLFGGWLAGSRDTTPTARGRAVAERRASAPLRSRPGGGSAVAESPARGTQAEGRPIDRLSPAIGTLTVDWTGCDVLDAGLIGRGITSEISDIDIQPDEDGQTLVTRTLWEGDYRLEVKVNGRSRWIPVRIDRGTSTRLRIRAIQDRLRDPPAGFGRVVVRVFDIRGEPVFGISPEFFGRDPSDPENDDDPIFSLRAGYRGRAETELRPGRYRIRLGAHRSTVDVPLDGQAEAEVRYAGEAEVIVRGAFALQVLLQHPGTIPAGTFVDGYNPENRRFLYLSPGDYEVVLWERHRRPRRTLRMLTLAAGERVELNPELPPGRIRVRITYRIDQGDARTDARAVRVVPPQGEKPFYVRGGWPSAPANRAERIGAISAEVVGIAPGRYRVEYLGGNYEPTSVEVVVGDKTATAELTFRRRK